MAVTAAPRAGETIEVTVRCSTTSGEVIRSGHVVAQFWAPGSDRGGEPDRQVTAVFDPAARGFTCWADTSGWVPGTWTVRGAVTAGTARGTARGFSQDFPLVLRP